MDLRALDKRVQKVKQSLEESEKDIKRVSKNIYHNENISREDKVIAGEIYHSYLKEYEKQYENQNEEYHKMIEGLSPAYLSMSEWYEGPDLKKHTFLDSGEDVKELYGLFIGMGVLSLFGISG